MHVIADKTYITENCTVIPIYLLFKYIVIIKNTLLTCTPDHLCMVMASLENWVAAIYVEGVTAIPLPALTNCAIIVLITEANTFLIVSNP